MTRAVLGGLGATLVLGMSSLPAAAHFQEILPSAAVVTQQTGGQETLRLRFTHPMEGEPLMTMGQPAEIGVLDHGKTTNLTAQAKLVKEDGKNTYTVSHAIEQPGDYIYYVKPAPYWEPAEGKMIVHYAKVVVDAYGDEEGWDALVGLPVEIEPLTRPYGNWTGSVFQGRVLADGKPVPFAELEIEYRGEGKIAIPADPFVTQVIKADPNGVFTVALPRAGWWGMAALITGAKTAKAPNGKEVPVEQGGLLWVNVQDMQATK